MNLEFVDLQPQQKDGHSYMLQKAVITPAVSPAFWQNWKGPFSQQMRKLLTLRKEMVNGEAQWVAYRLRPLDSNTWGSFSCSYSVRNVSRLLPYQPRALQYLCDALMRNGAALDGSDTGIGKTYVALAVCRELSLRPGIICKRSGFTAWKNGCAYMGIEPAFVINWESAKLGGKRFPYLSRHKVPYAAGYAFKWNVPKGILLIFDEAHVANHDDSQNCAFYLSSKGTPSLSLSATFADRPARMRPFFYLVGAMSMEQYAGFLQAEGHFTNKYNELESLSENQDMKKINKLIFPRYGYRLSYDDADVKKHFPEGVYQTLVVNLSAKDEQKQNQLYQELLGKVVRYREMGKSAEALVADLRYRQAAELLKAEILIELIREYVSEGRSVAVFVNFRETLAYLAKALRTKMMIFGDQERYKISREAVVNAFQSNKSPVILCMADAGGISLDLHDLRGTRPRISIICPTYNPVTLKQVLGRTRRAGSKSVPVMKLVYAAGTIEEKVAQNVNQKLDNISALNDGDLMEPDLFKLGIRREEEV